MAAGARIAPTRELSWELSWELCFKLGFGDGDLCRRGSSQLLLNAMKVHAKEFIIIKPSNDFTFFDSALFSKEIERMTDFYLNVKGAGSAHWGSTLSNDYWNLLEWPLDIAMITDHVRKLFALVVRDLALTDGDTSPRPSFAANSPAKHMWPSNTSAAEEQPFGAGGVEEHYLATRIADEESENLQLAISIKNELAPVAKSDAVALQKGSVKKSDEDAWMQDNEGTDSDVPLILRRPKGNEYAARGRSPGDPECPGVVLKLKPKPDHMSASNWQLTPELSSFDRVKRGRWPPLYPGSPPLTPSSKRSQTENVPRRARQRLPNTKASGQRKARKCPRERPSKQTNVLAASRPTPSPTPLLLGYELSTATKPILSSAGNVMFQFFLENETYSAIAKSFEQCKTMASFFDEAFAAWAALGQPDQQPRMLAVKAVVEGQPRPILVLWRNKEGFDRMVDVILKEAVGKEVLNVEIRCIRKV